MSETNETPATDLPDAVAGGDRGTGAAATGESIGRFDVVIAGGGMVGGLLAAALAFGDRGGARPLDICVLDEDLPEPFEPGTDPPHDIRVSALSVASRRMFDAVGAWRGIVSRRVCPYREMAVWDGEAERGGDAGDGVGIDVGGGPGNGPDRGGKGAGKGAGERRARPGSTRFRADDIGAEALGWIVENRVLRLALLERLADAPGVRVIAPARLVDHREMVGGGGGGGGGDAAPGVRISLDDGRTLAARVLVGADGARSTVRDLAGIDIERFAYAQRALVATVDTGYPQRSITWQRFLPTGPQAFLPLCGARASMVWYHDDAEIRRLSGLGDAAFLDALHAAFPPELGRLSGVVERGSFPIARAHATRYLAPRVALIGDAAHTVHPLAGQGVNLGMLDAGALAQVLLEAHARGADIGARRVLRRYERWRRPENALMVGVLDGFHRAFSPQPAPVRFARRLALDVADRAGPAKRLVTRRAMGLDGDLPRLAR